MRLSASLFAFALLTGCHGLDCEPASQVTTGDVTLDVLGTWDYWGEDSHVVMDLAAGGKGRLIEAPNQYASSGNTSTFSYSIDTDGRLVGLGNEPMVIEVSSTALVEVRASILGANISHPRVRCEGYGF